MNTARILATMVALALVAGCGGGGDTGSAGDVLSDAESDTTPLCSGGENVCDGICVDLSSSDEHCGDCHSPCAGSEQCVGGACTVVCPGTQALCDGACKDTNADHAHCGSCGSPCAAGEVCSEGACTTTCAERLTDCNGSCRDLQSDNLHCGSCDAACAGGQACSAGRCVTTCGAGLTDCSDVCRDLLSDNLNCGACGTACQPGEACVSGQCATSCDAGLTDCSGVCRDLLSDNLNCGSCGTTCQPGEACVSGQCATSCDAGLTDCSGVCRDLLSDNLHCGACGTACGQGEACMAGSCQLSCPAPQVECDGVCADLSNDNAHCGACDVACSAGLICSTGACQADCVGGTSDCGGVCRDLDVDPANCGACGTNCPSQNAFAACDLGSCRFFCDVGADDCDGDPTNACEISTDSDRDHCGACGNVCPTPPGSTPTCTNGVCGFVCAANFADCDGNAANGCEVDLLNEPAHCGTCLTSCVVLPGAAAVCANGTCVFECNPNRENCDGQSANGCEVDLDGDNLNCGACGTACASGWNCQGGVCVEFTNLVPGDTTVIAQRLGYRAQCKAWSGNLCTEPWIALNGDDVTAPVPHCIDDLTSLRPLWWGSVALQGQTWCWIATGDPTAVQATNSVTTSGTYYGWMYTGTAPQCSDGQGRHYSTVSIPVVGEQVWSFDSITWSRTGNFSRYECNW